MKHTIMQSEYFNALYEDGTLKLSGRPDYVNAETLLRTYPAAEFYTMPQDVCADMLDGVDYPQDLTHVPLQRCTRLR